MGWDQYTKLAQEGVASRACPIGKKIRVEVPSSALDGPAKEALPCPALAEVPPSRRHAPLRTLRPTFFLRPMGRSLRRRLPSHKSHKRALIGGKVTSSPAAPSVSGSRELWRYSVSEDALLCSSPGIQSALSSGLAITGSGPAFGDTEGPSAGQVDEARYLPPPHCPHRQQGTAFCPSTPAPARRLACDITALGPRSRIRRTPISPSGGSHMPFRRSGHQWSVYTVRGTSMLVTMAHVTYDSIGSRAPGFHT